MCLSTQSQISSVTLLKNQGVSPVEPMSSVTFLTNNQGVSPIDMAPVTPLVTNPIVSGVNKSPVTPSTLQRTGIVDDLLLHIDSRRRQRWAASGERIDREFIHPKYVGREFLELVKMLIANGSVIDDGTTLTFQWRMPIRLSLPEDQYKINALKIVSHWFPDDIEPL